MTLDGLCACGCGERTNLVTMTDVRRGLVKGTPRRYVVGHQLRGRSFPRRLLSSQELEVRFMAKVLKSESACWLWQGQTYRRGYGKFTAEGRTTPAHRWAYRHWVGPLDNGVLACHRCDTPPCVNPAHLFAGSQSDNIRDCMAKGRHPRSPLVRTHCVLGHHLSGYNLMTNTWHGRVVGRLCRICHNDKQRARRRLARGFISL